MLDELQPILEKNHLKREGRDLRKQLKAYLITTLPNGNERAGEFDRLSVIYASYKAKCEKYCVANNVVLPPIQIKTDPNKRTSLKQNLECTPKGANILSAITSAEFIDNFLENT